MSPQLQGSGRFSCSPFSLFLQELAPLLHQVLSDGTGGSKGLPGSNAAAKFLQELSQRFRPNPPKTPDRDKESSIALCYEQTSPACSHRPGVGTAPLQQPPGCHKQTARAQCPGRQGRALLRPPPIRKTHQHPPSVSTAFPPPSPEKPVRAGLRGNKGARRRC